MKSWTSALERSLPLLAGEDAPTTLRGRALQARFMGGAFLVATLISLASMALPQPPGTNSGGLFALFAATFLISAVLLWHGARLPEPALQAALALGTAAISLAITFSEQRAGVYSIFYLWIAITAFYFFSLRAAFAQVGLVAVAFATVLALERPEGLEEQWVITIGTVTGAGVLVGLLRLRVEQLVGRLFEAARTDPLTDLRNRRGFQELLDSEVDRSQRTGAPLSLLIIDLDHFKNVNDRLGHQAGDRVLRRFGQELSALKRRMDTAARVGGEEFAVVLPETGREDAYLIGERLREVVRESFSAEPVPITVSVGVTSFPEDSLESDGLLGTADQALYAAKRMGRDRTVLFNSEVVGGLSAGAVQATPRDEGQVAAMFALMAPQPPGSPDL